MMLAMPMPRSLPRALRLGAAPLEAGVIRHVQRRVEILLELAAIERVDEAGLERHRARRHGVAAAQLGAVDAHLARGVVDQALDDVGRLGPARAAIGADARRVGEHRRDLDIDRRRRVGAGEPAQMHRSAR